MPWIGPFGSGNILVVHAAVVPGGAKGKVLMFGGSEHYGAQGGTDQMPANPVLIDRTALYDVNDGEGSVVRIGSPTTDVFCAGHAFLGDGRLLIAGGTETWGGEMLGGPGGGHIHDHGNFGGHQATWIYDHWENGWIRAADMNFREGEGEGGGRWYPTVVTLPSGDVVAFGGHPSRRSKEWHENNIPERFSAGGNVWTLYPTTVSFGTGNWYPRLNLITGGWIFITSLQAGQCRFFDPETGDLVGPVVGSPNTGHNVGWDYSAFLLPLVPGDGYRARVMVTGGAQPQFIELNLGAGAQTPAWVNAGTRQGSAAGKVRTYAIPVYLPTGQIFIAGGINGTGKDLDAVKEPEVFTPNIDWTTRSYNAGDGTWQTLEEPATHARNYHHVTLLLPDGSVLTSGSNIDAQAGDPRADGIAQLNIEIFQPSYFANPARPSITSAPKSRSYAHTVLRIETASATQAASIRKVALIRCGSATHAGDFDQRYVALSFTHLSGTATLEATLPADASVTPPGNYMLWIVDSGELPCAVAPFMRIAHQGSTVITDRSTFSKDELDALRANASGRVPGAFYVSLEGFSPDELGITTLTPDAATLASFAPNIAVSGSVTGISAFIEEMIVQDPTMRRERVQRVVFKFGLDFSAANLSTLEAATMTIAATPQSGDAYSSSATFFLKNQPAPYMLDGDVPWLSSDVRVFKRHPGETINFGNGSATLSEPVAFIQAVINGFRNATAVPHPFDALSVDPLVSELSLATNDAPGRAAYNFVVARVRYRAATLAATDVRVFFRMFNWQATGLEFNPDTTYRRSFGAAGPVPLLGISPTNEVVSIPFFANARVATTGAGAQAMTTQPVDDTNRATLPATGNEVFSYFGAWLDFNQVTQRFPRVLSSAVDHGPYASGESLQNLVGSEHQCLVAEILFGPDPTEDGRTPAESDNLAQRNLAIDTSANPHAPEAHTVQTSFDLKLSEEITSPPIIGLAPAAATTDELMLRLDGIPAGSDVTVLLPGIDARQVAAASRGATGMLEVVDDETIRCKAGGAVYLALPGGPGDRIAGLLTVSLPTGISVGEKYRVVAHQLSALHKRIEGTFELSISVRPLAEIIDRDRRRLSVFLSIFGRMSVTDRRYLIFSKMILNVANRLTALGFPAGIVTASSSGDGATPQPGSGFADFAAVGPAASTRPNSGTQVINAYLTSGAGFSGQNIVTLGTGTRAGTYLVGYSLRYRIEQGTNSFAFRVADTTSSASGAALNEMKEHVHSQNVQPADRFHVAGWFMITLNGINKNLTLQCRELSGGSARIGYDDARLHIWRVS